MATLIRIEEPKLGREQMCKYICPYARFQFVMFDPDTLIIAYDQERGDPRGSRSRKSDSRAAGLGDCADCGICVQVCPRGIDIRNGLHECIGCAACIDACDQVMDKMGYAHGLIRYSTENAVRERFSRADILKRAFRPRILTYSAAFLALVTATAWSLATRVPLKADFARDRAALARDVDDGAIENVFRVQVTNASEEPAPTHSASKVPPASTWREATGSTWRPPPSAARPLACACRPKVSHPAPIRSSM